VDLGSRVAGDIVAACRYKKLPARASRWQLKSKVRGALRKNNLRGHVTYVTG
jgi:hypothetical protein